MPTNPPPTLNSDRTTTPADILANGLSSDPAGTPVQSMCLHCKKQFETHKFSLFEREIIPSLCPVCDAARDTRLSEWIALCPREFRTSDEGGNTSLARMDTEAPTWRQVLDWRYGNRGLLIRGDSGHCKTRAIWRVIRRLFLERKSIV